MLHPNILDAFILLAGVGTVLGAIQRGLMKELLHTVLFIIMGAAGWFFLKDSELPQDPQQIAKVAISASFYLIAVYAFMWGAMKLIEPLVMSSHDAVGYRSRFWAGALSIAKLGGMVLALNLWYAVQSPDGHPLRLKAFPTVVQESVFVETSDFITDKVYRWLAAHNILTYDKYLEKPTDEVQQDKASVDSMMRLVGGPANQDSYNPAK